MEQCIRQLNNELKEFNYETSVSTNIHGNTISILNSKNSYTVLDIYIPNYRNLHPYQIRIMASPVSEPIRDCVYRFIDNLQSLKNAPFTHIFKDIEYEQKKCNGYTNYNNEKGTIWKDTIGRVEKYYEYIIQQHEPEKNANMIEILRSVQREFIKYKKRILYLNINSQKMDLK